METTDRIRRAGFSCIAAGVLWTVAAMMQGAYSLQSSSDGVLYYLNEAMYFVAQAGFVLGIFGLIWARAAGNGWFGKIALHIDRLGPGVAPNRLCTRLGLEPAGAPGTGIVIPRR